MAEPIIRPVTLSDAKPILEIYTPFILNTSVTFEMEVPALRDFSARIESIRHDFPYIVAELDGEVCAYAYAHTYRERAAYRFNAELSVYVAPDAQRRGIARKLYGIIERDLTARNYRHAIAVIALPNEQSERFHERAGYTLAWKSPNIGYKRGEWHDTAAYIKPLMPFDLPPSEILRYNEANLVI